MGEAHSLSGIHGFGAAISDCRMGEAHGSLVHVTPTNDYDPISRMTSRPAITNKTMVDAENTRNRTTTVPTTI